MSLQLVPNPVVPVFLTVVINPDSGGQSMRLIQGVREAPLGPQVSGREKQLYPDTSPRSTH